MRRTRYRRRRRRARGCSTARSRCGSPSVILHVIGVCRPVKITRSARMSPRPDLTSASWPWSDAVRGRGRRVAAPPVGVGRSLGAVAAAAALPGLGHVLLGRRRTGVRVMAIFLGGLGRAGPRDAVHLGRAGPAAQPRVAGRPARRLRRLRADHGRLDGGDHVDLRRDRPRHPQHRAHQVLGASVSAALCAAVAIPLGAAADLANTQRALLDQVSSRAGARGGRRTRPAGPVLPPRLNVLLLGTDAGPDRTGARTDTIIVASVDTRTAATTLFALPRNIEHAPFPPGSPAAARFPGRLPRPARRPTPATTCSTTSRSTAARTSSWPPPGRPPTAASTC